MKKCYFIVEQEIVIGHIVSSRGLEVVKAKIDVISSLSYPSGAREVCSFLVHAGFFIIKDFMMSLRGVSHLPLSSNQ
jgi:hypothetical protein